MVKYDATGVGLVGYWSRMICGWWDGRAVMVTFPYFLHLPNFNLGQSRTPAPRRGYCHDRGSFPLFTSEGGARLLYIICLVVCPLISGIAV